jgi:hypothetical protein
MAIAVEDWGIAHLSQMMGYKKQILESYRAVQYGLVKKVKGRFA